MTKVFILTPNDEMTVEKTTIASIGEALARTYNIKDELLFVRDDRNSNPLFLADCLQAAPESPIMLVLDDEFMPIYGKDAVETEIISLLRNNPETHSFKTLADYIVPILQRAIAKSQAQKKENE